MKTSNKILGSALVLFLLYTAASTGLFLKDRNRIKKELQTLDSELNRTRIRTLVAEGHCNVTSREGPQYISLSDPSSLKDIHVSNDTLYAKSISSGYINLPDLKSYLLNGIPQPIGKD